MYKKYFECGITDSILCHSLQNGILRISIVRQGFNISHKTNACIIYGTLQFWTLRKQYRCSDSKHKSLAEGEIENEMPKTIEIHTECQCHNIHRECKNRLAAQHIRRWHGRMSLHPSPTLWLMSIIQVTWKAEIKKIVFLGQPRQTVSHNEEKAGCACLHLLYQLYKIHK
jgi:hypothetical protein